VIRRVLEDWWERSKSWSRRKQIAVAVAVLFVAVGFVGALVDNESKSGDRRSRGDEDRIALVPPTRQRTTPRGTIGLVTAPSSPTTGVATTTPTSAPSSGATAGTTPTQPASAASPPMVPPNPTSPPATSPPPPPSGLSALTIAEPRPEGYDRDLFVHWTDDDRDCQDARAEVLIAESRVPVTYTAADGCRVATGEWISPWSGVVTTSASSLDVDHTVALANAWRSGAWAWSPEQRRAFANDLSNPDHLIALPAGENRSKSDDGPEEWKPPNQSAWCRYAQVWTAIKARWYLTATAAEWAALTQMAATC
jgi:hypothetical protein